MVPVGCQHWSENHQQANRPKESTDKEPDYVGGGKVMVRLSVDITTREVDASLHRPEEHACNRTHGEVKKAANRAERKSGENLLTEGLNNEANDSRSGQASIRVASFYNTFSLNGGDVTHEGMHEKQAENTSYEGQDFSASGFAQFIPIAVHPVQAVDSQGTHE
jgi:hypothetical protein